MTNQKHTEEIVPLSKVPAQFNLSDAVIAELKDTYSDIKIDGVEDKEGYKVVKQGEKEVRSLRIEVEKVRKELKQPALDYGRAVDDEAKRLKGELQPIEDHLKGELDELEKEKERIKQEKANKRKERLLEAGFTENKGVLRAGGVIVYVESIGGLKEETLETFIQDGKDELNRLAEEKRQQEEAKRKRKEEEEKLRKEREEIARQKKEIEAEKMRLAREKADRDAKEKIEAKKAESEPEETVTDNSAPDTPVEEDPVREKKNGIQKKSSVKVNEFSDDYLEGFFACRELAVSVLTENPNLGTSQIITQIYNLQPTDSRNFKYT